jgi:hypothetical protein
MWLFCTVHLVATRATMSLAKVVSFTSASPGGARQHDARLRYPWAQTNGTSGTSWHTDVSCPAIALYRRVTYEGLPYLKMTSPIASTSPTSAPTGVNTAMCVAQATSQPIRP